MLQTFCLSSSFPTSFTFPENLNVGPILRITQSFKYILLKTKKDYKGQGKNINRSTSSITLLVHLSDLILSVKKTL